MSSSQHPIEQEELMAFLDGELPAERAASAAEHLKSCTECRKLAVNLQQVSQALVGWEVEAASTEIPASISSALDTRVNKPNAAITGRWPLRKLIGWPQFAWAGGLAVATLLVIAISVPSLLRSRFAAKESARVTQVRQEAEIRERTANRQSAGQSNKDKALLQHSVETKKEFGPEYGRSAGSLVRVEPKPGAAGKSPAKTALAGGNVTSPEYYAKSADAGTALSFQLGQESVIPAPPPPPPPSAAKPALGLQSNQTQFQAKGGPMFRNQNSSFNNAADSRNAVEVTASAQEVDVSGPMVIRTAELALTSKDKDFDQAHDRVEEILKRHHGYVGELNLNTPTGAARSLTATLRVPANQLEATVAELKRLGRVEKESQNGEEVTQQYVDLEARIKNSRNTEQRLVTLQRERTGKLSDVLSVETQISRVRGEIEQMEAQRKAMRNQVDYATLTLTISEDYKAELKVVPPSTGTLISNAAVDGYRSLVDGLLGLLLWLLSWLPSLLLWFAVFFFPARYTWRRVKQHFGQGAVVA